MARRARKYVFTVKRKAALKKAQIISARKRSRGGKRRPMSRSTKMKYATAGVVSAAAVGAAAYGGVKYRNSHTMLSTSMGTHKDSRTKIPKISLVARPVPGPIARINSPYSALRLQRTRQAKLSKLAAAGINIHGQPVTSWTQIGAPKVVENDSNRSMLEYHRGRKIPIGVRGRPTAAFGRVRVGPMNIVTGKKVKGGYAVGEPRAVERRNR